MPILFCLVYQGVFARPFYDNSGLFQKISEDLRRQWKIFQDYRRGPTIAKDVRRTLQTVISIFFGNSKP